MSKINVNTSLLHLPEINYRTKIAAREFVLLLMQQNTQHYTIKIKFQHFDGIRWFTVTANEETMRRAEVVSDDDEVYHEKVIHVP